ncbi:glyoxalase [Enterococcus phoeniculicola]|jgi:predicted lactoylglutathione lyase|uniref:Glyoxalase n=1 Tax=Enterococcus phoeniculicola ATCC BAA-412 TaxID=1158610 RepID=R3W983_9ENTE|nr:VOC family protein [Enterococcus phoeniculicola]EOL43997.1 glyoxalase [Enterococcus phoeniculicola ATCC BAA-412]EOT75099.1 glyoxalase [Enterococcus phoeniculicola ATCC BAA-412]OJG71546.1 glyoxalase [Enterococcus phoeniculicola]
MSMVFVNFPVTDVAKSTEFYAKLGFKKNEEFSNEATSSMVWDDHFWIMLLNHEFYRQFIKEKEIIDAKKTSGVLVAISMDSADAVKKFAETAKENGGTYYSVPMGIPEDQMFSLEVQDPDGNMLEPVWMNME